MTLVTDKVYDYLKPEDRAWLRSVGATPIIAEGTTEETEPGKTSSTHRSLLTSAGICLAFLVFALLVYFLILIIAVAVGFALVGGILMLFALADS